MLARVTGCTGYERRVHGWLLFVFSLTPPGVRLRQAGGRGRWWYQLVLKPRTALSNVPYSEPYHEQGRPRLVNQGAALLMIRTVF